MRARHVSCDRPDPPGLRPRGGSRLGSRVWRYGSLRLTPPRCSRQTRRRERSLGKRPLPNVFSSKYLVVFGAPVMRQSTSTRISRPPPRAARALSLTRLTRHGSAGLGSLHTAHWALAPPQPVRHRGPRTHATRVTHDRAFERGGRERCKCKRDGNFFSPLSVLQRVGVTGPTSHEEKKKAHPCTASFTASA